MHHILRMARTLAGPTIVAVLVATVWVFRERLIPPTTPDHDHEHQAVADISHEGPHDVLELSPQARKNLDLVTRAANLQRFWRSVVIPGEISDQPGVSDRGVTSPVSGVLSSIYVYPGDAVCPGERLFTIQLLSETLQATKHSC